MSSLPCPRCAGRLQPVQHAGIGLDECAGCGGVWLDRGELERAVATPAAEWPAATGERADEVRYLKCPRCGEPMSRRQFAGHSGVILDHCTAHGVWADPGELQRARAYVEGGGLVRNRRREEEARRLAAAARPFRVSRAPVEAYGWLDLLIDLT